MDRRTHFDTIALSCITYLESFPECREVLFQCGDSTSIPVEFEAWEKKHAPCRLPRDLKEFYSMFNGISLSWHVEADERLLSIGAIKINHFEQIKKTPVEGILLSNAWHDHITGLPDLRHCVAFSLVNSCEVGDIVLLYKDCVIDNVQHGSGPDPAADNDFNGGRHYYSDKPTVWFIDLSARWHYVCGSFTHYLRLEVTHLGIYGWQLVFTPEGLQHDTEQWMNLFCKERLLIDLHGRHKLLLRNEMDRLK